MTLHSFFRKVDPSAKKIEPSAKKSVEVKQAVVKEVEVKNVEANHAEEKVNHNEEKVNNNGVNHVEEKAKNDAEEKAKSVDSSNINSSTGSGGDEAKKPTSKGAVGIVKNPITSSTKEIAPIISEVSKKDKAPVKKKGHGMMQAQSGNASSTKKRINSSAGLEGTPSSSVSSSSTSGRKLAVKMQNDEEDLDDSPAFAVAAALRMVNKGRNGKSRRSGVGSSGHPVVVARSVDEKDTTEMVPTDEKVKEASSLGYTSAGSREEKENESSNAVNTVVPDVADTVRNDSNAVDIGERENVDTDTPLADASFNDVAMDSPDDTPIAFDCSNDEDSGREENSGDDTVTNEANGNNAAVDATCIIEDSHLFTENIIQQQKPICDSMKDEVVVDAVEESAVDDVQADGSVNEASDEVKVMPAKSGKKCTRKPRRQKDSSTPSTKSSTTKAASAATIGQSLFVSSLKKMAATTPKKSVIPPTTTQTMNQQQEPVCDAMKEDKEQATHSAVVVDAIEESVTDDVQADDNVKVTSGESTVMPEMSTQSTSKSTTKPTPESRNQASTASIKSSNPTASVASVTIEKSSIVSSLKKMTASTPKKSVISSATTLTSPSTTTEVPSVAKSDSSSSNGTEHLSDEDASRLHHYLSLRVKYAGRASELGNLPNSDAFEEENLCLEGSLEEGSVEVGEDGGFPDKLLTHLQVMTQGR